MPSPKNRKTGSRTNKKYSDPFCESIKLPSGTNASLSFSGFIIRRNNLQPSSSLTYLIFPLPMLRNGYVIIHVY